MASKRDSGPFTELLPPHSSSDKERTFLSPAWKIQDPRSSSTQSLSADLNTAAGKRTLLLIYVHGFMGDETSFGAFPAHVHTFLSDALRESHNVHTKIYPKYKTRRKVEEVREIFSNWLLPHETPHQDIILLGHSMGGILNSEVVLIPSYTLRRSNRYKHNILGTVNFDTPFLGMHYGIVGSGLGSLFRKSPERSRSPSPARSCSRDRQSDHRQDSVLDSDTPDAYGLFEVQSGASTQLSTPQVSSSSLAPGLTIHSSSSLSVPSNDPNFDPIFPNDTVITKRAGWANAWHFVNKHSDDLMNAAVSYMTSHMEFGGAMADYRKLKGRYEKVRALENGVAGTRVRFVNYWTASTGRTKSKKGEREMRGSNGAGLPTMTRAVKSLSLTDEDVGVSPRISVDGPPELQQRGRIPLGSSDRYLNDSIDDNATVNVSTRSIGDNATAGEEIGMPSNAPLQKHDLYSSPNRQFPSLATESGIKYRTTQTSDSRPLGPDALDPDQSASTALKTSAFRLESLASDASQSGLESRSNTVAPGALDEHSQPSPTPPAPPLSERKGDPDEGSSRPTRKERKFCNLPSKIHGERDPCWVKVFMPNADEVGAHCGLFSAEEDPERYEIFVQDVCLRIIDWLS